jgi:hypothetical protein
LYPEIDMTRSVIVAVDDHRVEKALHTAFGKRRQSLGGRKDGHTEWFQGDFLDEALSLVRVIAAHRETTYPEFRNVDVLLRDYLARNPNAGQRPPRRSKAERMERAPVVEGCLRKPFWTAPRRSSIASTSGLLMPWFAMAAGRTSPARFIGTMSPSVGWPKAVLELLTGATDWENSV